MSVGIDWDHAACLCDAGAPDYVAAVCVNADGQEVLWLVNMPVLEGHGCEVTHGSSSQAWHEGLGELPEFWRSRVLWAGPRCGRPRVDGQPCRQQVREAGLACCFHSDRQRAQT